MISLAARPAIFRRHIALPQDHGSWVFLLSPLLIGLFTANEISIASLILTIAALAGFLIRQPVTMLVKIYSGRRSNRDLSVALFWAAVYSLIGALAVAVLVFMGYTAVIYLAIPGIPVFSWHLFLVSRRVERRQIGVEVVGSGVLALAAPAAYWVGMGGYQAAGWWLFLLTWLQSAASIVYAYLRLEQRVLPTMPDMPSRLRLGRRAIIYSGFNFGLALILSLSGVLPILLPLPFALQLFETVWGSTHPALGLKPTRIGLRQLFISSIFTVLFILCWNYAP